MDTSESSGVNPEEYALCKRRGHDPEGHSENWERCKHCGMWTRMLKQEHENPPENERDSIWRLHKQIKEQLGGDEKGGAK